MSLYRSNDLKNNFYSRWKQMFNDRIKNQPDRNSNLDKDASAPDKPGAQYQCVCVSDRKDRASTMRGVGIRERIRRKGFNGSKRSISPGRRDGYGGITRVLVCFTYLGLYGGKRARSWFCFVRDATKSPGLWRSRDIDTLVGDFFSCV